MRSKILKSLYRLFPFDLRGDCVVPEIRDGIQISCVINFYGRLDLLSGILHSLVGQDFPRAAFEVVLVEDQGGTNAGRELCGSFSDRLPIVYRALDKNFGKMGYSRNFGLTQTSGEIVLFLDDDTVLLQPDFLTRLAAEFAKQPQVGALIPRGHASFALVEDRYDFHDPFFMSSRCMAYRREVLKELGGFMSDFIGQEDVEFVMRFIMAGKQAERCPDLAYYHPPLLVPNINKAKAVGASFCRLRERYPLPVWLLAIVNCSRHAPLALLPIRHLREMGRFGWGFMLGVLAKACGKKSFVYQ